MHYRFYHLNELDRIAAASDHDYPDDATAFSAALQLMNGRPIEAWQSTRLVFRVSPAMNAGEADANAPEPAADTSQ